MYVFIATIFIAELIIAGFIIYMTLKLRKKINNFNEQVLKNQKITIATVKEFHEILRTAQNIMNKTVDFVSKKKKELRSKLLNLAIIYALLIFFKVKFKRAASILQYALLLRDFWLSIPIR